MQCAALGWLWVGNFSPGVVLWSHPERQPSQTVSQDVRTSTKCCSPRKSTVRADVFSPGRGLWSHLKSHHWSAHVSTVVSNIVSICQHFYTELIGAYLRDSQARLEAGCLSHPALCQPVHCTQVLSIHFVQVGQGPWFASGFSSNLLAGLLTRPLALGSAPPAFTLKLSRHCQPYG